jgi:hypothetical protein
MTSEVTFGDFLDDARRLVAATGRAPAGGEDLRDTTQSIRRVVVVLGRYARDLTALRTGPRQRRDPESPWEQAAAVAHRELNQAARYLTPPASPKLNLGTRPSAGTARQMDGAAVMLQAARELLETHVGSAPDGTPIHRTEWAPALTSPPVRRALLAEVADLGRAGGRYQRPDRDRARLARRARAAPRTAQGRSLPAYRGGARPGRQPARTRPGSAARAAARRTGQRAPAAPPAQLQP